MTQERDELLESSMLEISGNYKPYSVGRIRRLRMIGNPMFGGESVEEWDADRRIGVAWVVFHLELDELDKIMSMPGYMKIIDRKWEEDMPYYEQEVFMDWVKSQASKTRAAQTEAVSTGIPSGKQDY